MDEKKTLQNKGTVVKNLNFEFHNDHQLSIIILGAWGYHNVCKTLIINVLQ